MTSTRQQRADKERRRKAHLLWPLGSQVSAHVRAHKALAKVSKRLVANQGVNHGEKIVCSLLRVGGREKKERSEGKVSSTGEFCEVGTAQQRTSRVWKWSSGSPPVRP